MTDKEKKVIKAMKVIKDYCVHHSPLLCNGCIFQDNNTYSCGLALGESLAPYTWALPEIKTRKDVLLEKYPDAEIDSNGIPAVCAAQLGLVACCEGQIRADCAECWMHEEDDK